MSEEIEKISVQHQFEELLSVNDETGIKDFLNEQNISDVADLIYENEEYETYIISHLSVHRAAALFRILEHATQKSIIQALPPSKTAELLNELPADDRTAFLEDLPNEVVRELIKTLNHINHEKSTTQAACTKFKKATDRLQH